MDIDNLPDECLLLVYDSLEDFDEAYNLAQSCRRFREVFQRDFVRILRSIITRSETYSYDTRLCHFIDVVQDYSLQYAKTFEPPTNSRPLGGQFIACYFATSKTLTEAHVFSIIHRWRRSRRLQNIYLRSWGSPRPLRPALPHQSDSIVQIETSGPGTSRFSLHDDGDADVPSHTFGPVQTRRFYKALVTYWLGIETFHLARVSMYSTAQEEQTVYELLQQVWIGPIERTLVEEMDVLEVHDFVYVFLLDKILTHDGFSRCWIATGMRRFQWGWHYFVGACRLHIRPFQIADLIPDQRRSAPRMWPHNRFECAGASGMFDRRGGVLDGSPSEVQDYWYSTRDLEHAVEGKILARAPEDHANDYANIWTCYRNHQDEQTDSVFWWAASSEDIMRGVDNYARESACLLVHPDFARLSRRSRASHN